MVDAGAACPVLEQQPQVQVPASGLLGPVRNGLEASRADGDGRHAGRRAKALLRRAVREIDVDVVEVDRRATQGGDGVDEEEGIVVVGQLGEAVERLEHTCGGLRVDRRQQLHLRLLFEHGLHGVQVCGLSPLHGDGDDRRALPGGDLLEAKAKEAVLDHHGDVTRLEEVCQGGLHACRASAGNWQCERLFRAEHLAQHLRDAVHDLDKFRVQVPQDGGGHGAKHARVHITGTGTQEGSARRVQLLNGAGRHGTPHSWTWLGNTSQAHQEYQPRRRASMRQARAVEERGMQHNNSFLLVSYREMIQSPRYRRGLRRAPMAPGPATPAASGSQRRAP